MPTAVAAVLVAGPWAWFPLRTRTGVAGQLLGLALPAVGLVAAAVAVVALLRRWRGPAVVATSTALVAVVATLGPWLPHASAPPEVPVVLAAANVKGQRSPAEVSALVGALVRRDADVLVVSELTDPLAEALQAAIGEGVTTYDVGVFSRWPVVPVEPIPGIEPARVPVVRVDGPDGPFLLVAAHLPRPARRPAGQYQVTFAEHDRQVRRIVDWHDDQTLPVVVAGDLNTSDRGPGYRALVGAFDDAMRSGWAGPTSLRWPQRLLQLRIDHVLVEPGWCWSDSTRFAIPGSDHRGVQAAVGPCG